MELDRLLRLLRFVYCLVPCYTITGNQHYYALVSYCSGAFSPDGNEDNIFVRYTFNDFPIYLHQETVNNVRRECENCELYETAGSSIISEILNTLNALNINIITNSDNINQENSYEGDTISIYQLNRNPTSIISAGNIYSFYHDRSLFIKNRAYVYQANQENYENIQRDILQELLGFKRNLILRILLRAAMIIVENH